MKKNRKIRKLPWKQYGKYIACAGAGIVLFLLAEISDMQGDGVEKGVLHRNPCGQGEAVYEFYVDGLGRERIEAMVTVPEQKMSEEEFRESVPEAAGLLCSRILGKNPSLAEVREDLELVRELPEYGLSVSWESERPELLSHMGLVSDEEISENGETFFLRAVFSDGESEETVEIPVTVFPKTRTEKEKLLETLNSLVLKNREAESVLLPERFGEWELTYKNKSHSQNSLLILLGIAAAGCLYLKERSAPQEEKKRREEGLVLDYPDLVSGFLILTGAGFSVKQAWKKLISDHKKSGKPGFHPVYEEMEFALNQMEAGKTEVQAYAEFGRRCGLRCYMKFASLLESCLYTGGKNLRKLLEEEMETAFKARADLARRKGEEASTKLLLPMFGMLGIVMVMVVAPAFLSLG